MLGAPGLAEDPRFATNADRVAHRPALVAALETVLSADTVDRWVELLATAGLPAGRVGTVADGFALAGRLGLAPTVEVGEGRPPQVRSPLTLSGTPVADYGPPPRLGEHNDEVRARLEGPAT